MTTISARLALQGGAALGLHRALCAIGGRVASTTTIPTKLRVGTFRPAQIFPWSKVRIDYFLVEAARRRICREDDAEDAIVS